ncbi:MAG TPA: hypothetical protein VL049_09780 [Candidatus Dormibacteraeota bacterium]|nr:hypothetical protein [Candidatus Dormibacteraeota bacterium]
MLSLGKLVLAAVLVSCLLVGAAAADDAVKIKKWKSDSVELLDKPDGKVVATKPAAELPMEAVRSGQGWLKVAVGGKDYYVEASQARTDLKLSGKPKCDNLGGATGHAASRGLGDEGCEP